MSSIYRPWSEVRIKANAMRAKLHDELIHAPLEQVPAIQARVQIIDQFIRWFENGADADTMIDATELPSGY